MDSGSEILIDIRFDAAVKEATFADPAVTHGAILSDLIDEFM